MTGLRRIAREFPFDLVHAQHYGGATRSYFACRRYGWPQVYEIHSLLGDEVERDRLGRGATFRFNVAVERRVCRHAAAVIVLGEPVRRVVVEEKGVPPDRVSVIYPGIDLDEYARPGAPAAIPGVGPEHKVIMYVGSIVHPNQGVPILIESLPRVFDALPEARCVLVGGPAEAGEDYRRRLGPHGDRLIVLTGQTPEQVVALTRRADVLVHPRLACRENYSVQSKIAVYLASGRPIVATDFGDYSTILGDHRRGPPDRRRPRSARRRHPRRPDRPGPRRPPLRRDPPRRPRPLRHGPQHRPLPRRLPPRPGRPAPLTSSPEVTPLPPGEGARRAGEGLRLSESTKPALGARRVALTPPTAPLSCCLRRRRNAALAQLVEQLIRNEQVLGSSPRGGFPDRSVLNDGRRRPEGLAAFSRPGYAGPEARAVVVRGGDPSPALRAPSPTGEGTTDPPAQARTSFTTRPWTSVRRKSRPPKR